MATFTASVVASTDDAQESPAASPDIAASVFLLSVVDSHAGQRFVAVTVPNGATIVEALVSWEIDSSDKNDAEGTWYGEDVDDAATFTATDGNLDGRTKTTASVAWTTNDLGSAGAIVNSPNLASIVQEIVDRPGWAAGNDIVLIYVHASTTDLFQVATWDHATRAAPSLSITWADPPAAIPIVPRPPGRRAPSAVGRDRLGRFRDRTIGDVQIVDGDTGTGVEAEGPITLAAAETGTGVDAETSIALTEADSGTGVDAETSIALDHADTGTGTDAETSIALDHADTGTGTDAETSIALTEADTASGTDAGEAVAATLTDAELGTGTEVAVSVEIAHADTGTALEGETVDVVAAVADLGVRTTLHAASRATVRSTSTVTLHTSSRSTIIEEAGPMDILRRVRYFIGDELEPLALWWFANGSLVDLSSAHTYVLRLAPRARRAAVVFTKSDAASFSGATGSGTEDSGTPNLTIAWRTGAFDLNLVTKPGEYVAQIVATRTSDSRERTGWIELELEARI